MEPIKVNVSATQDSGSVTLVFSLEGKLDILGRTVYSQTALSYCNTLSNQSLYDSVIVLWRRYVDEQLSKPKYNVLHVGDNPKNRYSLDYRISNTLMELWTKESAIYECSPTVEIEHQCELVIELIQEAISYIQNEIIQTEKRFILEDAKIKESISGVQSVVDRLNTKHKKSGDSKMKYQLTIEWSEKFESFDSETMSTHQAMESIFSRIREGYTEGDCFGSDCLGCLDGSDFKTIQGHWEYFQTE